MPKTSPLLSWTLQAAQEKQPRWYTRSRARITSSFGVMPLPQRPQRFKQNSLRQRHYNFMVAAHVVVIATDNPRAIRMEWNLVKVHKSFMSPILYLQSTRFENEILINKTSDFSLVSIRNGYTPLLDRARLYRCYITPHNEYGLSFSNG